MSPRRRERVDEGLLFEERPGWWGAWCELCRQAVSKHDFTREEALDELRNHLRVFHEEPGGTENA